LYEQIWGNRATAKNHWIKREHETREIERENTSLPESEQRRVPERKVGYALLTPAWTCFLDASQGISTKNAEQITVTTQRLVEWILPLVTNASIADLHRDFLPLKSALEKCTRNKRSCLRDLSNLVLSLESAIDTRLSALTKDQIEIAETIVSNAPSAPKTQGIEFSSLPSGDQLALPAPSKRSKSSGPLLGFRKSNDDQPDN
jgi:hypothetical protein